MVPLIVEIGVVPNVSIISKLYSENLQWFLVDDHLMFNSVLVGRWTDNETGKILKTCNFNKKYFWGTITAVFWSFDKNYKWLWSNSETSRPLLVLVLCFLLLNYADIKCSTGRQSTVRKIVDPSQTKISFHFFPKSGALRKTSLTLWWSGEVWT